MGTVATLGRRKRLAPPANARIDWSHPLAQGLLLAWVPTTRARTVEMVRNAVATVNGTVNAVADPIIGVPNGVAANSATGNSLSWGTSTAYATSTYTVATHVVMPSTSAAFKVALSRCSGNVPYDQNYFVGVNTGYIAIAGHKESSGGAYKNAQLSTASAAGKAHLIVGTYDGTNITVYGEGLGVASTAATAPTTTSAATLATQLLAADGTERSAGFNSSIGLAYIWNRALSATEVVSLYEAPFQMMVW